MTTAAEHRRVPPSQLLFDVAVLIFAGWTLLCHLAVFTGATPKTLFRLALGAGLVALGALGLRARRVGWRALLAPIADERDHGPVHDDGHDRQVRIAMGAACVALLVIFRTTHDAWWTWSACVAVLVGHSIVLLRRQAVAPVTAAPARSPRWMEIGLWILVLLAALLTLSLHRDNSDDSFYVNVAVSAVDFPDVPLFSQDMLHGLSRPPPAMYHITSFELLAALVSAATGIPALLAVHLLLGTLGGMAIPLALARLYRGFDPARWWALVPLTLSFYVFDGTSQFNFSMHGFARAYQGKAILWSVMLPALVSYGVAFGARPTRLRFVLLCAAQIAGVGLSSTGLWLMPVAASIAVAVPLRLDRKTPVTLLMAVASSGYVVAVALWVRSQLSAPRGHKAVEAVVASAEQADFTRIAWSFKHLFGGEGVALPYMVAVFASLALAPNRLSRRYLTAFCLVLAAVLLNPLLFEFLAKSLLGNSTAHRALWLLPLPAAVAFCAGALIPEQRTNRVWTALAFVAACGALGAFYARYPHRTNVPRVHLRFPPGPKVQHPEFEVVERLTAELPAGSYVVAPRKVSVHLSLVHGYLRPVIAKKVFFGGEERERRLRLRRAISHRFKTPIEGPIARWLRAELDHYEVKGVVTTRYSEKNRGLVQTLKAAGFERIASIKAYRLWKR